MERSRSIGRLIVLVLLMSMLSCACALASWQENGNAVCATTGQQFDPQITSDGAGGAIIAWEDYQGVDRNIYARRVDEWGNVLWTANGVPICTATDHQDDPQITSDGAGGAIITWWDYRGAAPDIYARRVDASGNVLWTADGVAVCTATGGQSYPQITSDGAGGAIMTWQDWRGANRDIYARRVDASGNVLWTADGEAICTATGHQDDPQITSDGAGGAIITWEDYRSGTNYDIYARRVDASGNVLWTADGEAICTATGGQDHAQITSDGAGGAIMTWEDGRGPSRDIYARRVDASGNVLWTADGEAICGATNNQFYPQITSDGAGGAIITWEDYRSGTNYDVYAQRVDASGNVLWTVDGVVICTATGTQGQPEITSDGVGGAIITWWDYRNGNPDVYAQRVDASGNVLWTVDGAAICTVTGTQDDVEITSDGAGGAVIAWEDYRSGNDDIYSQRIERNGYWGYPAPDIYAVGDVPGDQGGFANVAWDASRLDPWPEMLITEYTVWSAVSAEAVAGMVEEGAHVLTGVFDALPETEGPVFRVAEVNGETLYWKLMSTLDAYYLDTYSEVIPTLFDSTSVCDENHYFQVIAHTDTPSMFWISEPDSGYSVDNISPEAPQGVSGDYSYPPAEVLITWDPNTETDLSQYAVYKGTHEGFVPGEGNRLGVPQDTFFVDDAFDPNVDNYYKVSAWDIHENESGYSLLRPDEITGVSSSPRAPAVTRLEQNVPNPFNPVTVIRFSLAQAGWVELRVYDVAGRPVRTLVYTRREADRYQVAWDGLDDSGRAVASGVYLYKLDAPGYRETKKMVLLR